MILVSLKVCIISSQLANQLGFTSGNFTVSSVGSPEINFKPKDKEKLRLLYVGTLQNRNIHETVIGLKMAIQKIGNEVDLEYTIIGDSNSGKEKLLIKRIIQKWDLSNFVRLEGYIPRTKLNNFSK